jgi:hypothetical protein
MNDKVTITLTMGEEDEQINVRMDGEFEDDESMTAINLSTMAYIVLDILQDELSGIPDREEMH